MSGRRGTVERNEYGQAYPNAAGSPIIGPSRLRKNVKDRLLNARGSESCARVCRNLPSRNREGAGWRTHFSADCQARMLEPSMRGLERRLDCRYRFAQPLQYTFERQGAARLGSGQTVELGASGVLFHADSPPPEGARVELQMMWPFLVQGVCSVVLVIQGTVVRSDARGTALRLHHYLFQTAESRAYDCAIGSGAVCNLIG
jgi:hypothetical protein